MRILPSCEISMPTGPGAGAIEEIASVKSIPAGAAVIHARVEGKYMSRAVGNHEAADVKLASMSMVEVETRWGRPALAHEDLAAFPAAVTPQGGGMAPYNTPPAV